MSKRNLEFRDNKDRCLNIENAVLQKALTGLKKNSFFKNRKRVSFLNKKASRRVIANSIKCDDCLLKLIISKLKEDGLISVRSNFVYIHAEAERYA